jgi:hypothetical protein
MTHALSRIGKQILRFEIIFGAGFTIGSIYVAALITFPKLISYAARLL